MWYFKKNRPLNHKIKIYYLSLESILILETTCVCNKLFVKLSPSKGVIHDGMATGYNYLDTKKGEN